MKRIVGFGDSWMWGDELIDPLLQSRPDAHPIMHENTPYRERQCFLGQLGEHYQVPTENFGWPGASLLSTIWCYLWWLEHSVDHEDAVVLVALTESSRTSWYNPRHKVYDNDPPWNRFQHSSWIHAGGSQGEWGELTRLYTALSDCLQLSRLNYQHAVYFFQGQQHRHPVCLLPVSAPPCRVDVAEMVMPGPINTWLRNQGRQCQQSVLHAGGHPNELGHKLICDLLINHLDRAILT
jgi:hypothetical protein